MAEYSMQQLEALAAMERGEDVPTEPPGGSSATYRHPMGSATYQPPPLPRDVRRDIYNAVYSAGRAVGRAEIAKALGVKKTPWLCQHIERLVDERFLVKIVGYAPTGATMYFYGVAEQDGGQ